MRNILLIILSTSIFTIVNGQTIDKETIQNSFSHGVKIYELIKTQDSIKLKNIFDDKVDLMNLLVLSASIDKNPNFDIYYDPISLCFIFSIYNGNWIDNNTSWGLYDYRFIIELFINLDHSQNIYKKSQIIIGNTQEAVNWWNRLMKSYRNEENLRHEWAKKFGLVPPPPPPPNSIEWNNQ